MRGSTLVCLRGLIFMFTLCDMHCDTATECFDKGLSLYENNLHIDFKRLNAAGSGVQFFAVWIKPEEAHRGFDRAVEVIDYFRAECAKYKDSVTLVENAADFDVDASRIKAVLSVEGGEALNGETQNLKKLYNIGVRLLTLTWNGRNQLGEGAMSGNDGLTEFGKTIVGEMNRLGMIIDVSHLSEAGFWDVAQISRAPFVASHSNARAICNHPRNLTDQQIKHLIKVNGFMGINLYPPFLTEGTASLDDIYAHIDHCLSLGAQDILGFGADFDGIDKLPCEIAGVQDMYKIIDYLLKKGLTERFVRKIKSENLIRATKEIMNFFEK